MFRMYAFLLATAAVLSSTVATACPFCSAPSLTLSEQISQADAVVLVKWVDGRKPTEESPGFTEYEIIEIAKSSADDGLSKKQVIKLPRYRAAEKGDLFVINGIRGEKIEWESALEVTETSYQYMTQAPTPEEASSKRLSYFVRFLEYPDTTIANDAYGEFANAPYEDITPLADEMPREKLRKWIVDPETTVTRLGLYGLLLGLCGNDDDARLMEQKIVEPAEDFRLGIDGIMSGYLLLRGKNGLDVIDETKLKHSTFVDDNGEEKEVPFSETYAAMQALRFMWTYGDGRISKDRLRQSMRILLDRPELADLVIADLSRWKDWSVQDRLMELYDAEEYNIPSIKRAIVRYLLQCEKQETARVAGPAASAGSKAADTEAQAASATEVKISEVGARAKVLLKELEEKDPKLVKEAKRFMF